MTLSTGEYLLGLALLLLMLAAAAAAAWLLLRRRLAHLRGAPAVVAFGLLMAAAVLAVHVVPLALGVLSRATVAVASVLLLAAATRLPRAGAAVSEPERPVAPSSPLAWAVAAASLGAIVLYAIAFAAETVTDHIKSVDALSFHLPHSAHWIQSGSLWSVESLVPGWAFGHYPNNGDVYQLAAILPWHNDLLVRFVTYPFAVLGALSIYAGAVELGARRAAAATFAALAIAVPTSLTIALDLAMTDTVMHATFAAGALFGLRHARTGATSDLVLAALGLGLALGTKWYGLSSGAAVVVVWIAARLIARHPVRQVARQTGAVAGVMAAAGGVWLLRNLILSGNPVFPVKVSPLGVTLFDAPPDPIREAGGFALTHYATEPGLWERLIVPELLRSFGFGGVLLVLAAIAGLVLALRGRHRDGRVAALAAAALLCALVYAATPYSAFGPDGNPLLLASAARYGVPAIVLAGVVAAWLASRLGRAGIALELLGFALVLEAIRRYEAFHPTPDFSLGNARTLAAGAAGLGLLAAAVWFARRIEWRRLRERPLAVAAALAAALAVVALAGDRQQRAFNEDRYAGVDPAYDWLLRHAPADRRIGLAGTYPDDGYSPPWIAFGPRLENEVEYVGRWVQERLELHRTEAGYRRALQEGDYDVVLVALGRNARDRRQEAAWTAAAGYVEVTRSKRLAVFRAG